MKRQGLAVLIGAEIGFATASGALPGFPSSAVALGPKKFRMESYWRSRAEGIEVQWDDHGFIRTVFIRCGRDLSRSDWHIRNLALGVTASSTRDDVRSALGPPTYTAPRGGSRVRKHGPWDRYDTDEFCVHFEYEVSGQIHMIALMDSETAPGPYARYRFKRTPNSGD
jgi:hypothetical protein